MHVVAATVDDKRFLAVDGVPWHGAVREPAPSRILHNSYDFDWFDDGEAEQVRRDNYAVAWRDRTWGVHDKPTRGFYPPKEHLFGDALPNRVATSEESRHF